MNYKEAYDEFKLVLDYSFDQITIADEKGVFLRISKSCEEYFGIEKSKMIGESAFELEKKGIFDCSVTAEVLRKRTKVSLVQKTKANKNLYVTGIPMYNPNGKIKKIVNISRDITEKEQLSSQVDLMKERLKYLQKKVRENSMENNLDFHSKNREMIRILKMIDKISDFDVTVLLLGETGVGKSYYARQIHENSHRKNNPFVTINCGAIPENLLESELFGYEKGAFTGAQNKTKKGLFEIAGKGTVFLDEIGDLPLNLQVKLLHAIENKKITRLGGTEEIEIHARILSAINKNLEKEVEEGNFRRDLYYRLNIITIEIPPLRARREDIIKLTNKFLNKYNAKYNTTKMISEKGMKKILNYDFPGNIRELENQIEKMIIISTGEVILETDIEFDTINESNAIKSKRTLKESLEYYEKMIIQDAYNKYHTTREIGKALGIDQSTVVKKAKKYNIK